MTRLCVSKKTHWLSLRVCRTSVPLFRGGPAKPGSHMQLQTALLTTPAILWQFYVIAKQYGNMILLAYFENLLISCSKACLWEKSHWHRTSALEIAVLGDPRLLRRALSHSYCGFFPGVPHFVEPRLKDMLHPKVFI